MPHQSSITFDEKVYALSKIVHKVKFRNNRSEKYTSSQLIHLRLFDDIALLMITEPGSDVAAVAFEQRTTEIIFYFAKNRPATTEELTYIRNLAILAQNSDTTNWKTTNRIDSIFNEVVRFCGPKILTRFSKILRVLTKLPPDALSFQDDTNGDLDRHLQKELGVWYDTPAGPAVLVDKFFSHLCGMAPKKPKVPNVAGLGQIIRVAHATGSFKCVEMVDGKEIVEHTVYPNEDLATQMRLLGNYFGAVKRIVRNVDSIKNRKPTEIRMQELVPAKLFQCRMPTDYLTIANNYATERNIPTISYDTLKNAYPDSTFLSPDDAHRSQSVTFTVHAECTVAMFMASLSRPWEFVKIGSSKGSCWLCERYLELDTKLKFHVSNEHGKLQPGWSIPPGGDAVVNAQVAELIGDELEEIVLRAVGN
ncbi:hypothetical protein Q9L58_010628 [Maublancomyces gigas]|uniref:C2H2-type domain-containing protein n=1 Tax=Discina gigas TaxID=1032678 RepID=A0ABR3G3L1_9PEZI